MIDRNELERVRARLSWPRLVALYGACMIAGLACFASCAPSSQLTVTPAHAEASRTTERTATTTVTFPKENSR